MKSINHIHSPHLLCSPSSLLLVPHTHTYCTYFTVLSFILMFKFMLKGVSPFFPTVGISYFGPYPFHYSPLSRTPPFSTTFSAYPYILSLLRHYVLWYYWCCIILFSWNSFLEFLEVFHYYKHFYMWVCSMYIFVPT
jgi:hypothetical protein